MDFYPPDKFSAVSEEPRYTYAEFGERFRRMAAGILAKGTEPGDRIGLLSFNINVLLDCYYGAPLASCIVMPINLRLHQTELEAIRRRSKTRIAFY